MPSSTLQSLFRDSKNRATDRETFVQVLSKLSSRREPPKEAVERPREKQEAAGKAA
jgi:hypothetical protein